MKNQGRDRHKKNRTRMRGRLRERRRRRVRIINWILCICLLFFLGFLAFSFFSDKGEKRSAGNGAKNISQSKDDSDPNKPVATVAMDTDALKELITQAENLKQKNIAPEDESTLEEKIEEAETVAGREASEEEIGLAYMNLIIAMEKVTEGTD